MARFTLSPNSPGSRESSETRAETRAWDLIAQWPPIVPGETHAAARSRRSTQAIPAGCGGTGAAVRRQRSRQAVVAVPFEASPLTRLGFIRLAAAEKGSGWEGDQSPLCGVLTGRKPQAGVNGLSYPICARQQPFRLRISPIHSERHFGSRIGGLFPFPFENDGFIVQRRQPARTHYRLAQSL